MILGYKIWGFHSRIFEHSGLLGCYIISADKYRCYNLTVWMKTLCFFETLVTVYHLTWCHIPEDLNLKIVGYHQVGNGLLFPCPFTSLLSDLALHKLRTWNGTFLSTLHYTPHSAVLFAGKVKKKKGGVNHPITWHEGTEGE